jgi:hypothetical protein
VRDLVDDTQPGSVETLAKTIDDTMNDLFPYICCYDHGECQCSVYPITPGTLIAAANQEAGETLHEILGAIREISQNPSNGMASPTSNDPAVAAPSTKN